MKEIIATGKTVDLAIEEACQQLGVPREKAEFEITAISALSSLTKTRTFAG